jgi:hypothetical protein
VRYTGKHRRRYRRDIYDFANLFTVPNGTLTNAAITATVRALVAKYGVGDERDVVWDVQDAIDDISHQKWPRAPRVKTRDELLAEGHADIAASLYPNGGTIEEVLLTTDETPSRPDIT